jgi:NADH:ubiquinone oxidoreductase subunit
MSVLGLFTWWREATWGTKLQTWYRGEEVGVDGFGNRYYLEKGREGRCARRWVMYNGLPIKALPTKFRTTPHWMICSKKTPEHLRKALDQEVSSMVKSGIVERIRDKYRN